MKTRLHFTVVLLVIVLLAAACGATVQTPPAGPPAALQSSGSASTQTARPAPAFAARQDPAATDTPAADATPTPDMTPTTDAMPTPDATPGASDQPGGLTAAQSAYLDRVDALVDRLSGSAEIRDAILAMRDATQSYGLTKTFDAQTANQKVSQAAAFMSALASDVNALQPPPMFKSVQDELQGAVDANNTFLKDSTTALNSPSSETMGTVQLDMLGFMFAGLPVTVDSSNRRSKGAMGLPQVGVDTPLTADETAYLGQVQALLNRMQNSSELNAALGAFGDDIDTLQNTGQLDGKASAGARAAAVTYLKGVSADANALRPPARLQSVQVELLAAVSAYSNGLSDWGSAITAQKWDAFTAAFQGMARGTGVLMVLGRDLAFLGVK